MIKLFILNMMFLFFSLKSHSGGNKNILQVQKNNSSKEIISKEALSFGISFTISTIISSSVYTLTLGRIKGMSIIIPEIIIFGLLDNRYELNNTGFNAGIANGLILGYCITTKKIPSTKDIKEIARDVAKNFGF